MKYWKIYFNYAVITSISLLILGCFPKQQISTETFLLAQPALKQNIIKSNHAKIVYLKQIQTTAPFDSLHFIFKLKPARYQLDYYHHFLNFPSKQLMAIFATKLNNLTNVKLTSSSDKAQYILGIKLNKFYVDNTTDPKKAIIDLSICLRLQANPQAILWWHTYHSATPIKNYTASAGNIVLAWDQGIQTILQKSISTITDKLAKAPSISNDTDN